MTLCNKLHKDLSNCWCVNLGKNCLQRSERFYQTSKLSGSPEGLKDSLQDQKHPIQVQEDPLKDQE